MARSTLRRADRVSTILDRISGQGSVDAGALAAEFDVSVATIRRDLQTLEDQKLLNRTHGGAIAADVSYELPVRYRIGQHRDEKLAIASRYAGLVEDRGLADAVFGQIRAEWDRTVGALLEITGQSSLLEHNPDLAAVVRSRLPYIDPLNHLQIELIRRRRRGDDDEAVREGIHLTINGVAAGLRNSG